MEREFDFEKPVAEMEKAIEKLKASASGDTGSIAAQIAELEKKCEERKKEIYDSLTPWQTVQVARHPKRPVLYDYISLIFSDFIELHGDRAYGDDRALIGGFAKLGEQKVMLIGHSKGKNVDENVRRNFGMARPEGYRKALRLMRLAEKYNVPVVTFIDTPGAYPGLDAEERGQAEAIARNLTEMAKLEIPIVSIVTGEGGSGGALGIGVADVVLMLSNAVYSVISPEGCASILWRDAAYSAQAADSLKITAKSLLSLDVIDEIVKEPAGGAHTNHRATGDTIKKAILKHLKKLLTLTPAKLTEKRFEKFSAMGKFIK
ncbi:MAG: acetyl-CoA carboxylase carboxyltransferase subunit alpha [Chitinispirillales bacterium]|jgi:acetyl-CoA carboxylase carboxyl transferase subunit alpha|nr:acetyl-CoA carboxylase carboxyltransferase subunit alpha [Chitinispirillales bacterium]